MLLVLKKELWELFRKWWIILIGIYFDKVFFFKKDNKDILWFMIVINDLYYLYDDILLCKFKNNVKFMSYEKLIYKLNIDLLLL